MKRTAISVGLLIILGVLLYLMWQKFGTHSVTPGTNTTGQQQSQVEQLLQQATGSTDSGDSMQIPIDNVEGYTYEGGGEYKPFFPQTVKDALNNKKNVILYFYADRDATDKALDLDIQKKKERIPKNTVILRIDYDSNAKIRDSFDIKQQNTLVWLNTAGTEITRRSMGITSLSQIVRVEP